MKSTAPVVSEKSMVLSWAADYLIHSRLDFALFQAETNGARALMEPAALEAMELEPSPIPTKLWALLRG